MPISWVHRLGVYQPEFNIEAAFTSRMFMMKVLDTVAERSVEESSETDKSEHSSANSDTYMRQITEISRMTTFHQTSKLREHWQGVFEGFASKRDGTQKKDMALQSGVVHDAIDMMVQWGETASGNLLEFVCYARGWVKGRQPLSPKSFKPAKICDHT